MKRLTLRDVHNLPGNHPLWKEFERQVEEEDKAWDSAGPTYNLDDEQSLEYFNRYIAGDR